MAFGKDPSTLNRIGSHRQVAQHSMGQRQQRKPRGSGAPTWVDKFRPSLDQPDTVRIIPGDYEVKQATPEGEIEVTKLTHYLYGEHFHATLERGSVCSAGPFVNWKDKRDPCYACDLFWSGMQPDPQTGKKKRGPMSRRDMASFTVIHFHPYHQVEQVDLRTGQVRVNQKTGQPFYSWVQCTGRGCEMCKANKIVKPAHRLHWDMGTGHFNTLWEYDKVIGNSCTTCGGRDVIAWDALVCRECGEAKVIADETTLQPKEIDEIYRSINKCSACGFEGFLKEVISCKNCSQTGHIPQRSSLFDVNINVQRFATDNSTQTTLMVTQWSQPCPIDPQYKELAEPLELEKIFAPTALEDQAAIYGLTQAAIASLKAGNTPAARQPVTPDTASRPYR